MSISTDVSGSDELSLDGSESNLLVEAARKNAALKNDVETSDEATHDDEDVVGLPESESNTQAYNLDEENQRTVDLDLDDSDSEVPIGNRATLQLAPDANVGLPVEDVLLETQTDLSSHDVAKPVVPEDTDAGLSTEQERADADKEAFSYVAFDDGLPPEDSIHDASMQSLDIGVESLSLDDSLHLSQTLSMKKVKVS